MIAKPEEIEYFLSFDKQGHKIKRDDIFTPVFMHTYVKVINKTLTGKVIKEAGDKAKRTNGTEDDNYDLGMLILYFDTSGGILDIEISPIYDYFKSTQVDIAHSDIGQSVNIMKQSPVQLLTEIHKNLEFLCND